MKYKPASLLQNIAVIGFTLLFSFSLQAQDKDAFTVRKWRPDSLGKAPDQAFIFTLASGYGFANWKHTANNVYQYQDSRNLLFAANPSTSSIGYTNLAQSTTTQSYAGTINSLRVSELTNVQYRGSGGTIPIHADLLFAIGKFRIGAAGGYEFFKVNSLAYKKGVYEMDALPISGKLRVIKYGLKAEFIALDLDDWRFGVQAKGGLFTMKGDINKELVKDKILWAGAGAFVEKPLGDVLIAYGGPSYEYRRYASGPLAEQASAQNTIGTIFINIGIRARLENLFAKYPLCPIPSCHTRKQHQHNKQNYRGQPIFKKQNPRIGESLPPEKKHKIKKPYVEKDPKKQAAKAQKQTEKANKKKEKEKARSLKSSPGTESLTKPASGTGIQEDPNAGETKKERKARLKAEKEAAEQPTP